MVQTKPSQQAIPELPPQPTDNWHKHEEVGVLVARKDGAAVVSPSAKESVVTVGIEEGGETATTTTTGEDDDVVGVSECETVGAADGD